MLWIALIALPWWLPLIGGYTALGSKVLIYAIATMGLNLVLGFTGGLSFGQAAYFGLGAYGAGMTLKYLAPSTPLAILVGTLAGGLAATLLGPLVMRRRGIYFAMITIAIGQLFYFVMVRWNEVTGGEDGLAGFARQEIHLGRCVYRLTRDALLLPRAARASALAVAILWAAAAIAARAHLGRHPREPPARASSSASASSATSGRRLRSPASSPPSPARSMRCCSISPRRRICTGSCRAIS